MLPTFCEGALRQYRALGWNAGDDERTATNDACELLDVFIFGTRDEWELFTKDLLGHRAAVFMEMGRGGFSTRGTSVLYDVGMQDTLRIVAHEGWHQFVQSRFIDSLPIWLDEGIASCMETSAYRHHTMNSNWLHNPDRLRRVIRMVGDDGPGDARTGHAISLEGLLRSTPEQMLSAGKGEHAVLDYYARVWSLVLFLSDSGHHRRYHRQLDRMIADARDGRFREVVQKAARENGWDQSGAGTPSFDVNAFRAYFNADLAEAQQEYTAFLVTLSRLDPDAFEIGVEIESSN
jgi:hypothetical protein